MSDRLTDLTNMVKVAQKKLGRNLTNAELTQLVQLSETQHPQRSQLDQVAQNFQRARNQAQDAAQASLNASLEAATQSMQQVIGAGQEQPSPHTSNADANTPPKFSEVFNTLSAAYSDAVAHKLKQEVNARFAAIEPKLTSDVEALAEEMLTSVVSVFAAAMAKGTDDTAKTKKVAGELHAAGHQASP